MEGKMTETSSSKAISTKLKRIATLAKELPGAVLTTLAHHIDIIWLKEAYRRTRKDAAPGIDGRTGWDYADALESNLQSLLERAKDGDRYRAMPVRRVEIPKGDGRMRPLGIPTFEDKVLQRAVAMVLEAVYEQDFLDCSYGYRRGRSTHDGLKSPSTNPWEASFRHEGSVSAEVRLAPEVAWVEIKTQVRGQIVPRTLFGGGWEEHGRGLVQNCRR